MAARRRPPGIGGGLMVRCPACGTMNGTEDAFCGNCGTALSAAVTAPDAAPGTEPIVDPVEPATPAPPPETVAGPSRDCPVCGASNAMSRTFCRVCGSTLPAIGGQAGAGSPRATRTSSTSPVPAATTGRAAPDRAARAAARSGGGNGWLIVLAGLGLLAGVLFVLLPSLLGSRPATEAQPSRALPTQAAPSGLQEARDRLLGIPGALTVSRTDRRAG